MSKTARRPCPGLPVMGSFDKPLSSLNNVCLFFRGYCFRNFMEINLFERTASGVHNYVIVSSGHDKYFKQGVCYDRK